MLQVPIWGGGRSFGEGGGRVEVSRVALEVPSHHPKVTPDCASVSHSFAGTTRS